MVKKDFLQHDYYIILGKEVVARPMYVFKTISTNPKNPLPYIERNALSEGESVFSTEFGTLGTYVCLNKNTSFLSDLHWHDSLSYYKHDYEIAVVLTVDGSKITVYGEKTDKEIEIDYSPSNIVLTPYAFKPQVGHEMLLLKQKYGSIDIWHIVHNITLAKLKRNMWTKMK